MPLPFLSLKELAMRTVLQEDVSFEALPNTFTLRRELDKLCDFPGSYKLNETRPEKFTKTGGGAPTPEEINRIKSTLVHSGYRRYLYHQGNEQTTGGTAEAAAKPWLIPAGKYFAAHRPQGQHPLQGVLPLHPVREWRRRHWRRRSPVSGVWLLLATWRSPVSGAWLIVVVVVVVVVVVILFD